MNPNSTGVPTFTAHPVREGDCFELCWRDKRVLVDGGIDPLETIRLTFSIGHPGIYDVVACTHNDRDHSKGLLCLVELGWTRSLWIPAPWVSVLKHATEEMQEGTLEDTLRKMANKEIQGGDDRDRTADGASFFDESAVRDAARLPSVGVEFDGPEVLAALGGWRSQVAATGPYTYLDAYRNIVALVQAALRARVRVVPLEFKGNVTDVVISGALPELRAHNAHPAQRFRREKDLLCALSLTVHNKHALTFRWDYSGAAVFFCSDSHLGYAPSVSLPPGALVTVPHHGSAHNVGAYARLGAGTASRVWVRSDRDGGKRPCAEYVKLQDAKFCTVCRGQLAATKRAVELQFVSNAWTGVRGTPCVCHECAPPNNC